MKKALSSGVVALAASAVLALAAVPATAQVEKLEGKAFDAATSRTSTSRGTRSPPRSATR